jgi:CubicO group peptidase (beta-lactamase class C family)
MMKRSILAGAIWALLLAHTASVFAEARDLAIAAPAEMGMDPAKLAELAATMRGMVDNGELSAVTTAISRGGKLVHWQAYGYQDTERSTPLTDDSIFRIYSMTKPIAGVALMSLWEEGKFKLDDPVEKYIPELKNLVVAKEDGPDGQPITEPADHPMTIRELVSHTAGLTYGFFARSQVDSLYLKNQLLNRTNTLKEFVTLLGQIPLKSQPGSTWEYSVAVDVQGYLVEALTGKPFDVVLKERIFEPLGMPDTDFWVPPEKAHRLATIYGRGPDGNSAPRPLGEYLTKPALFSGGGGLVSTAGDYLRFAQMLGNGGELDGVRILEAATLKLMHTNQMPDSIEQIHPFIGNPGNTFGIDFAIVERPDGKTDHMRAQGEFWWYGAGGTWFGVNPVQDLVIVGMIQSQGLPAARKARLTSKLMAYEAITDAE